MNTAHERAKALFEAEWDLEDDQDATFENEEKNVEKEIKVAKSVRKTRLATIQRAIKTSLSVRSNCQSHSGTNVEIDEGDDTLLIDGFYEVPLCANAFYRGEIKNGTFSQGELVFSNGDIYVGSFFRFLRHGFGIFKIKDHRVAKGKSSKDSPIKLIEFEGVWTDDRKEGVWGKAKYSNGDIYEGPFHADKPDTSVIFSQIRKVPQTDRDAEVLIPEEIMSPESPFYITPVDAIGDSSLLAYLEDGHLAECGPSKDSDISEESSLSPLLKTQTAGKLPTYRFADGRLYVGELKSGVFHGRGALRFKNGDLAVGHFEHGNLHGDAMIRFNPASRKASNSIQKLKTFIGTFKYGKRFRGELTYVDGKVYNGYWDPISERPHGKGVCKFRNGDVYMGEWYFGKMDGRGRLVYSSDGASAGKIYDGEWESDKPHGRGVMLLPSGVMVDCLWDEGKQVPTSDQNAKVSSWKELAESRMEALSNLDVYDPLCAPPPFRCVESMDQLNARVENWKRPMSRKTGVSSSDMPSLAWFETEVENGEDCSEGDASIRSAEHIRPHRDDSEEIDSDDLDLSEDGESEFEIDYQAIDEMISAKEKKGDGEMLPKHNFGKENLETVRMRVVWEHLRNSQSTANVSLSEGEQRNGAFLQLLRKKGFAAELLASVEDYEDTDEEDAQEEERKRKEKDDAAKDASWFTGEAPSAPHVSVGNTQPAAVSPPTGTEVLMKGWLDKYSIGKSFFGKLGAGSWKTRYFVLCLKGASDSKTRGSLAYFTDESCTKTLGTVDVHHIQGSTSSSVLYLNPTLDTHKKADRPDVDLVVEYEESRGTRYKLLLRASNTKDRGEWVRHLSSIIKILK